MYKTHFDVTQQTALFHGIFDILQQFLQFTYISLPDSINILIYVSFLLCDAMLVQYMLSLCVCPSVRLSYAGIMSKS